VANIGRKNEGARGEGEIIRYREGYSKIDTLITGNPREIHWPRGGKLEGATRKGKKRG